MNTTENVSLFRYAIDAPVIMTVFSTITKHFDGSPLGKKLIILIKINNVCKQ